MCEMSLVSACRDLERRIAHAHEFPIPRLSRDMVPLQIERRGESVYAFIQQLHYTVVAAIDVDFANPDRTRRFNSHRSVGRSNPGAAHPSKTFPHPIKNLCPIVVPLIAIAFANEIGNTRPISAVDCVKEMFCVEANLMLGSPKPKQIYADAQCNGQHADDCSTKRNRHRRCNDTTSGSNPRRIREHGRAPDADVARLGACRLRRWIGASFPVLKSVRQVRSLHRPFGPW